MRIRIIKIEIFLKLKVYFVFLSMIFLFIPVGKSVEVGNSKKYNPACGPSVGRTCDQCGHNFKIGGPIWSEPIHDRQFMADLQADVTKEKDSYATFDRINGMYGDVDFKSSNFSAAFFMENTLIYSNFLRFSKVFFFSFNGSLILFLVD